MSEEAEVRRQIGILLSARPEAELRIHRKAGALVFSYMSRFGGATVSLEGDEGIVAGLQRLGRELASAELYEL